MKRLLSLPTIIIILISSVFAGELFDMDFSDSPKQVQILNEHEGVVLLNKDFEWGRIVIDKIHGQDVDLRVFSSDSKKLVTFATLNAVDEVLQVDINKDNLADFVMDIQSPKNNEITLIVKKLFEDTETPTIIKEGTSQQITGAVINPPKETKSTIFLITGLIVIIGLVSYYIFIRKKR